MSESQYDLKSVKLPRLAGTSLQLFASALETSAGRGLLAPSLINNAGITEFRKLNLDAPPTFLPIWDDPSDFSPSPIKLEELTSTDQPSRNNPISQPSITDYAIYYRTGKISPEEVAQQVIHAIQTSNQTNPPLGAIISSDTTDVMQQAAASTQRWKDNQPLSIFDGVPVAIKDEIDQAPYPTTVGTRFLGASPATRDATVVARMRAAGALLIGKTNMHEIGIGVTGNNPHHGTPRNPYNPDHYTGGSSSGVAAAVAAGLCPVAIGADGGGSIRIPASFCGVFGLKPTYGRVSESGAFPLCWSVAHIGPLAVTALDAALAYAIIAGADPLDANTLAQPLPTLQDFDNPDLRTIKIGIFRPWFEHASPSIVQACNYQIEALQNLGAQVVEITIPKLEMLRVAHVITISSEMAASLDGFYEQHHSDYSPEVRINLALANTFTSRDYLRAQQARTIAIKHFSNALNQVHVIATPTTGITAPPIPLDALQHGESDLTTLTEIMRFAVAANLTGLPAISIPSGYDENGLPIGLQLIGRPWHEHTLLRLANLLDQVTEKRQPQISFTSKLE
jgi:Asp-tRNA(Asn)/Glu-tRNA(Gln) amidotransferase A subunit family amidase